MSLWRQLTRGLRALRHRRAAEQDISDEVDHFLDESTEEHVRRGLSPEDARRAARVDMGSRTAVAEEVRGYGWENRIETLVSDVRYALRRLRGNPGFTVVSVLMLALGIGASATIFSVIDGVLLKPLPYPQSERLVALRHTAPGLHIPDMNLAVSLFLTYREENRVFQDLGMYAATSWTVTGLGTPEEVPGLVVTQGFLSTLEARPALGRGFTREDEDPAHEQTVMLSDGYWQSRFGGDRAVLGRRIVLDGNAHEVIGVLAPSFQFMDRKVSLLAPLRFRRAEVRLISFCCQGIARMKPGVSLEQASADVARMLPMAPEKFAVNPGFSSNAFAEARFGPRLRSLKDYLVGDLGSTLWVLMGTVGLVLVIACANVANLMLVRAEGRRPELAVRVALGAPRARIARELLLESVLLGVGGGLAGWGFATVALRTLLALEWVHVPRVQEIGMDPRVLLFTVCVSLGASVVFGLIPVFKYARPEGVDDLRASGLRLTGSRERQRTRSALVAVQVALALVLLVGSGLMIRTFQALLHVDPGFSGAEHLETVRVGIPGSLVESPERVARMEEEILRRMSEVGGVERVAAIDSLPLEGGSNDPVYAQDRPSEGGRIPVVRRFKYVSPGYFAAAGSRMIAGRDLTWAEVYQRAPVALVSENLARAFWSEPQMAIGKRIRPTLKDDWREVIGVVADLHDDGIEQPAPPTAYWPLLSRNFESQPESVVRSLTYVIRTPRAGTAALRQEMQQAVSKVNATLPLADVKTLGSVYERSLARSSLALLLLMIAGSMALLLGAVGLYAVISYSVSQRTKEIGIRLALGAVPRVVAGQFVRHGLRMAAVGALFGLVAALGLSRLMRSMLYSVSPADPMTYGVALAVLILAAVAGSYLPARRAARVDPVKALRAE
ncbi:ABC transporter permease [uncultured Paludibaculum sp.]|uniref:ABC transporter permease n=1 Tax=uncultured Paludibaculum sp. TaxID=1765020 RepID=UPI002AAADFB5|nr:ABC transporter permease [uncultured Paludibaculum sp.]